MNEPSSNTPLEEASTTGQGFNFPQWPDWQTTIAAASDLPFDPFQIFENPFDAEDLAIFDDITLHRLLHDESLQLSIEDLASGLHDSSVALLELIEYALSPEE